MSKAKIVICVPSRKRPENMRYLLALLPLARIVVAESERIGVLLVSGGQGRVLPTQ